jgi:predicted nucleic acid-binding protein
MERERINKKLISLKFVGIDTSPFIYHFEANPKYVQFTNILFSLIERGSISAVTSTITLMEILVKPEYEGNFKAVEDYKLLLKTFPNLRLLPIDDLIAEKAASIRARYGLNPADALQVSTAIVANTNAFITNDIQMKKVKEIKVVVMKEILGV